MYKCDVWVEKIDISNGWFYNSCNVCNKRLAESGYNYSCYKHGPTTPRVV